MPETRNREQWLNDFVALSLPLIKQRTSLRQGDKKILISCGFPSSGGRRRKKGGMTIGECHTIAENSERKTIQIFVHPVRTDMYEVGEVVLHELLHALLPHAVQHRKPFSQAAKKLGLLPSEEESFTGVAGKPKSTQLSKELAERVKEIGEQLGEYPHEKLETFAGVQTTRLIKCECPICGYLARVTAKWLDEVGPPICPQDNVMFLEGGNDADAEMPLFAEEQHVIYRVKATSKMRKAAATTKIPLTYDPQWLLSMDRKGNELIWHVVDMGPAFEIKQEPDGTTSLEPLFNFNYQPRHYKAENKADAIALLEGLRDGTVTPEELDLKDDIGDPYDNLNSDGTFKDAGKWDDEGDYEDDEEEEIFDFDDTDADPRFPHEIAKGVRIEDIHPDDEADKREGWAS